MRTCKKCGAQFQEEYNFCNKCGEKYTEYVSPSEEQSKTTISTSDSSQVSTFLKFLPLGVSILGFIVAWESDWVFGLIACIAAAIYSYSRYNNSKSDFDKLSLIVSAGASLLIIVMMIFL